MHTSWGTRFDSRVSKFIMHTYTGNTFNIIEKMDSIFINHKKTLNN